MKKHVGPLLTISCDNKEVRNHFYDAGILEQNVSFSDNSVAIFYCKSETAQRMTDEIYGWLESVNRQLEINK